MKNNQIIYKMMAVASLIKKQILFPEKEKPNYCIFGANFLNQKNLHYSLIGEKVVQFFLNAVRSVFLVSMSEFKIVSENKSLMESIQRYYGGEVNDSDSLIARLFRRFNGSDFCMKNKLMNVFSLKQIAYGERT